MVSEGDDAPDFTAPAAMPDGDITEFSLADALADGPGVLAFFPGAFTSVCTGEMVTFRDRLDTLQSAGANLYGVSIDSPFSLGEFAAQNDLNFPLISDTNKELIDAYNVEMDFEALGISGVAKRAVFVVDEDGTVTYKWVSDDPSVEPDYDEVEDAAAEAA
ncbi:MAG: peroxiredoxin [Natronomonas sp.]|jgi:peroxiredoxin|uniref:redoxin domain-containing protein n=1 Tax=Natronomonas sp. TaxID=2184060 RepID=UPI0039E4DABD